MLSIKYLPEEEDPVIEWESERVIEEYQLECCQITISLTDRMLHKFNYYTSTPKGNSKGSIQIFIWLRILIPALPMLLFFVENWKLYQSVVLTIWTPILYIPPFCCDGQNLQMVAEILSPRRPYTLSHCTQKINMLLCSNIAKYSPSLHVYTGLGSQLVMHFLVQIEF